MSQQFVASLLHPLILWVVRKNEELVSALRWNLLEA
jgi:hypothetical protein